MPHSATIPPKSHNSSLAFGQNTSYAANSVNEYTSINGGGFQVPNPSYDNIHLRQGCGRQGGSAASWNFSSLVSSSLVYCVSITDIRHVHYDAILLRQGYGGQDGNVIALTNSTGNISARYRYSPFGELITSQNLDSSGWNERNLHRFSTKPEVAGTGLLYYGYRWYDPATGRWPSRDPIEESGGMNLYGFVGNEVINSVDYLGLKTIDVDRCEAYLYIGHGSSTDPIKWNMNGACALGGAVTCWPDVNQPNDKFSGHRPIKGYPSDNLWPNVPIHGSPMTAGGLGVPAAAWNSGTHATAYGYPMNDPRSEHNSLIAIKNALDSIGQAVTKLCGDCCDEVTVTVEIGNDKMTNSFIENAVQGLAIPLGGHVIDDDNGVWQEVFRCP